MGGLSPLKSPAAAGGRGGWRAGGKVVIWVVGGWLDRWWLRATGEIGGPMGEADRRNLKKEKRSKEGERRTVLDGGFVCCSY